MSKTPRTDALITMLGHDSSKTDGMCLSTMTEFARSLELELAELKANLATKEHPGSAFPASAEGMADFHCADH